MNDEEYITRNEYDYTTKSIIESLTKISKDYLTIKEENQELRKRIYRLEQFGPIRKV